MKIRQGGESTVNMILVLFFALLAGGALFFAIDRITMARAGNKIVNQINKLSLEISSNYTTAPMGVLDTSLMEKTFPIIKNLRTVVYKLSETQFTITISQVPDYICHYLEQNPSKYATDVFVNGHDVKLGDKCFISGNQFKYYFHF